MNNLEDHENCYIEERNPGSGEESRAVSTAPEAVFLQGTLINLEEVAGGPS